MPIDHLTINARSFDQASAFYALLLPELGFEQAKHGIWRNGAGLYVQLREARPDTRDYERYGPGLNHVGFRAPNRAFVEELATRLTEAGLVVRLQSFADGTVAAFIPDPDGLRVEVSWYPESVPPVD
ncbi:glyoxalase [Sphingomonas sp. IC081]|nr:glyoxalase [Sphingomonas sp. IC081]